MTHRPFYAIPFGLFVRQSRSYQTASCLGKGVVLLRFAVFDTQLSGGILREVGNQAKMLHWERSLKNYMG